MLDMKQVKTDLAFHSVMRRWGVTLEDIKGTGRSATIVAARRDLSRRLRKLGYSFPEIGKMVDRVHTTIINHCYREGYLDTTDDEK